MTSPALNKPKRSEEEAQWDIEHRRHTTKLADLGMWIRERDEEVPHPNWEPFVEALEYALKRLHNEQAARIKTRAK